MDDWDPPCEYVGDVMATDGRQWYRCVRHGAITPHPDKPCAGFPTPRLEQE